MAYCWWGLRLAGRKIWEAGKQAGTGAGVPRAGM